MRVLHSSQPGPSTPSSAGGAKKYLSPEMVVSQANPIPPKQILRHHTKRTRPSQEAQHPTSTTRSMPASPKKRVTSTTRERSTETDEQSKLGVKLQAVVAPQPSPGLRPPIFSGNFDLYGMYLPALAKIFLPPGETIPDYPAVYDRILTSQARRDYTARCFLAHQESASSASPQGRFESTSVLNPATERPFDIILDSFTYKKSLTFTLTERLSFQSPECSTPGPGLVGHTGLSLACGIKSSRGVFKFKRVWAKEQDSIVKELFEGFFSFSVSYDSMYRKGDHGNGAMYKFAFWGVRAMKDNTGKEIGLGQRKTMW